MEQETPRVIYYEIIDQLNEPSDVQSGTVFLKGLYRPDLKRGVDVSNMQASVEYRDTNSITVSEKELRDALEGKRIFKRERGTKHYSRIGEIVINADAPASIQRFTTKRVAELMALKYEGPAGEKMAAAEIESMFDEAARIVIQQQLTR